MVSHKILLFALVGLMLTTACSSDGDSSAPPSNKHTRDEILASWTTPAPGPVTPDQITWAVADSTVNILSTMSLIALPTGIDEDSITTDDKLAVFAANQCLGVANCVATSHGKRFIINIYKPYDVNTKLTIAYYSTLRNRAYYWQQTLTYAEDAIVGHVNAPYLLNLNEATQYPYKYNIYYLVAPNISSTMTSNDIIGIFVGNECRGIIPVSQMSLQSKYGYMEIGLYSSNEKFRIRHFLSTTGLVYSTDEYDVDILKQNSIIRPKSMEEEK